MEEKNNNPIKITHEDLRDSTPPEDIDVKKAKMNQRADKEYPGVERPEGEIGETEGGKTSLSGPSLTAVAGAVGALAAWILTESLLAFSDAQYLPDWLIIMNTMLFFSIMGALTGGAIGAAEGVSNRSADRAIKGAGAGFFAGMIGCALGGLLGEAAYSAALSAGDSSLLRAAARASGWGIAGIFMGMGQGIALKSKKKTWHGLLGGLAGGLTGGLLFNPVTYLLGGVGGGLLSRGVALVILGASIGAGMGIVEQMLKQAWLIAEGGPLEGKQFIIYRNPTIIGSSPKCEIYLFKDPSVAPQHAAIHIMETSRELEDMGSASGTFINDRRVQRETLKNNDFLRIGKSAFRYMEKDKGDDNQ